MSKFTIRDEPGRCLAQERIAALDLNDRRAFDITVEKHIEHRSLNQNSLVHAWFAVISKETGDPQPSVKEDMIAEFAPLVESNVTPGKFRSMRTSAMNKEQMSEFMERIMAWAGGFGYWLPSPEEAQRHG